MKKLMQLQPEQRPKIGYVVSTWPRLSQPFALNEIFPSEQWFSIDRSVERLLDLFVPIRREKGQCLPL